MIGPAQLRAARALLDWSRAECGAAAGVSPETIKNIEKARFTPDAGTIRKIEQTFGGRGVGFFDTLSSDKVWGVFQRQPADNDNDPAVGNRQTKDALALAGRMANAIAATIHKRGHCRPRDLEAKGFTRQQIADAWALASALAAVEAPER
jgi:transcriptional regulator with XRE-family HTH domain